MIIFKFAGYIVELLFALNFYFVVRYSTNIFSNGCCLIMSVFNLNLFQILLSLDQYSPTFLQLGKFTLKL